jgi:membrane protein DedA with SNARE-associated domain
MNLIQMLLPYLGLCGGILLEGESFLLAASISAHYGYMNIYIIIALTIICTQISDWFWFLTGRKGGYTLIQKRPKIQKRIEFIYRFIDKYPYQVLFFYRFLYGFRSIMPLVLGTSRVKTRHFLIFGLTGTFVWSIQFALLGYYFGSVIQAHLQTIKKFQHLFIYPILLALIIIVILFLIRRIRKNLSENTSLLKKTSNLSVRIRTLRGTFFPRQSQA